MSDSHNHNLKIIVRHHRLMHIEDCWKNVKCFPDVGVREDCDVFGVTRKAIQGLWNDADGRPLYLAGGVSFVGEYKDAKSDLRADEHKRCRRRDVKAMGDYRMIWIRRDGKIEPHDIDEQGAHYGWGVVVFDENQCEIVRPPLRMTNVARWESNRVYGECLCRQHQRDLASLKTNYEMHAPRPAVEVMSAPRSETIREDDGRYSDIHTKAAEVYIAYLPATTSMLIKHLATETGWDGTPDKLTKHLTKRSKRLIAPKPGGLWRIKHRGGEA